MSARIGSSALGDLGCDLVLNPQQDEVVPRSAPGNGRERRRCGDYGVSGGRKSNRRPFELLAPFGRLCLFGGLPKTERPRAAGYQCDPLWQFPGDRFHRAVRWKTIALHSGSWPANVLI